MPAFGIYAMRSLKQVRSAEGFLDGSLLPDRGFAFWTMTVWHCQEDMLRYMLAGAHKQAMRKLMEWCDEASVVHWEESGTALPSWTEADRRMRAEGRASKVRKPSSQHLSLSYRVPRVTGSVPIRVAAK